MRLTVRVRRDHKFVMAANRRHDHDMIYEAVIITQSIAGEVHITPMGYRYEGREVLVAPFVPSQTATNLREIPFASLNATTDVRVIAGCLVGRRGWPTVACEHVAVRRLGDAMTHLELAVRDIDDSDPQRPRFVCDVVHSVNHQPFLGFNRAQHAVVEAAITVSRLTRLERSYVKQQLAQLAPLIEKTASAAEREAWQWLVTAVAAHPDHGDYGSGERSERGP